MHYNISNVLMFHRPRIHATIRCFSTPPQKKKHPKKKATKNPGRNPFDLFELKIIDIPNTNVITYSIRNATKYFPPFY